MVCRSDFSPFPRVRRHVTCYLVCLAFTVPSRFVCTSFWVCRLRGCTFGYVLCLPSFRSSCDPFICHVLFIVLHLDFLPVRILVCVPLVFGSSSSSILQHIHRPVLGGSQRWFSSGAGDVETPAWSSSSYLSSSFLHTCAFFLSHFLLSCM